ncbi:hypothetical protein [Pseudomonas sp. NPDC089569]|uniref:hypothetical protein n=1 Tax=Pseudomonas sp. NPDC089569 TaxID=3390722 RepID=UPI003D0579CE
MNRKFSVGLFALMALAGNTFADTTSCPQVSDIKQSRMDIGGYVYTADGPRGQVWNGENDHAEASYLKDSNFSGAQYKEKTDQRNSMDAVICDYEGSGAAGVRLVLKPVHEWQPADGSNWTDKSCQSTDVAKCSFNHIY